MNDFTAFFHLSAPIIKGVVLFFVAFAIATAFRYLFLLFGQKYLALRGLVPKDFSLRAHFYPSMWLFLTTLLFQLGIPLLGLAEKEETSLGRIAQMLITLSCTWFLIRSASLAEKVLYQHFDVGQADNMKQQRARTQLQFIFKVISLGIAILGFSVVLLSFPGARRLGTSLLASAGIATAVVGLAAQKSLGNFFAGFQIAFTQPIRMDDVVIVEGEWGRVEEISLTYVVVKLWDLRRLVLPITYFTEKPFQNWTRTSAKLLGYIYLYTDFRVPVDSLRVEFRRILEATPLWNGETCVLQVTDLTEKTMQIRALMSANDASIAFDLRCHVREKLLAFLQEKYPDSLPRVRLEMSEVSKSSS